MRKFTSIITGMALATVGMTANAAEVYLVGDPTDGETLEEWGLTTDAEDVNAFYGEFTIPAGEFKFYFEFWGMPLVPSAGEDTTVVFEDNTYSDVAELSMEPLYWIDPEWEGGKIAVNLYIDVIAGNASFTITSLQDSENEGNNYWYISGEFNDFDPAFSDKWALMDDEDNPGVYTGTFTIDNAADFRFNLMNYDGVYFVPFDMDDFDAFNAVLDFTTDHSYFGNCMAAFDEEEEYLFWSCPTWQGGMITISVDINAGNFPEIEIYAFPTEESEFNENYTITNEPGSLTSYIYWEDATIDDVWYESGEAYLVAEDGTETELVKNISGRPGQITLLDTDPYGFEVDLTSLELANGTYTVVIPANYIQIVSNDWEDWLYNPEISYEVIVDGTTGVNAINPGNGVIKVYNLQGVKVLETEDASTVKNLNNGIYIINGKKVIIRK